MQCCVLRKGCSLLAVDKDTYLPMERGVLRAVGVCEGPAGVFVSQFGPCSIGLHVCRLDSAIVNGSLEGCCV